ncbi:transmembrane protein (macronuclear) [Tetrahymena thermophila SB210]|uniref:Transmembrane protein n=1 Tax=Tetrahymena thermophila (strain SB210) TaxID=312017 RepID=Q23WV2_TETTS|nr:transmembrane protein [Tetrahymena thermophila SB210]EAS00993.1 transmembrane protein [Tetrahymena thermophila SB210]|eukprot:XP_001021238.1 transmembrane protein [Tetrahymena thermophila SB210]
MDLNNNTAQLNNGFKRFLMPEYSIPVTFGLLGLSSFKFFKCMKYMYIINHMKRKLSKALPVKLLAKESPNYSLAYASGKIQYDPNISVIDYHFGVKPVDDESIGIYRKVDVYNQTNIQGNTQFVNYEERSFFASVKDYNNVYISNQVFTKGQISLEDHKIADSLIKEYARENMKQISIEEEEIRNYVEQNFKLKEEEEEKEKEEADLLIKGGIHNEESHPLRQLNKRQLIFKDNYIYFQKTPDQLSQGDVRISFYEIGKVDTLTILAGKKEDQLQAISFTFNGFDHFARRILLGKTAKNVWPVKIKYICEGIIPFQDLLSSINYQVQRDDRFFKLFYFVIIYLLYNYLESEIALLPENHSYKLVQQYQTIKQVIDFELLRKIFSFDDALNNFADDSKMLAALHYAFTALFIRLGMVLFGAIAYFNFHSRYKEITQQKQLKNQQHNEQNNINV